MEYDPVRIQSHYSPNPVKQENYIVICHSHRVRTIVTAKPAVVRKWVYKIRHLHRYQLRRGRLVVGLGLCVGHNCLIFQLLYADHSPSALHRFLSEPNVTFAGVWNYRDARMLRDSRHSLRISRLMDVRQNLNPSKIYLYVQIIKYDEKSCIILYSVGIIFLSLFY
ncbi:hypothetical protein Pfo_000802 [Paulownia fortunei]|nr:hypothetical protein Pfo_000802 [Paulownia fortunei]